MKHKHERNALREELKQIAQLKRDLEGVKAERDAIKLQRESELKSIAVKLGVPDTPHHIRQRIAELDANILEKAEALGKALGKIGVMEDHRNNYKADRDDLKKQLTAYQTQGFFGRLLGLVPKAKYDRLWDKPSRPITPSPESE
jgi:chromosome segregation ATPase